MLVTRKFGHLCTVDGIQNGTAIAENSMEVSQTLEIELPWDPAMYLTVCIQKLKASSQKNMCTHMS